MIFANSRLLLPDFRAMLYIVQAAWLAWLLGGLATLCLRHSVAKSLSTLPFVSLCNLNTDSIEGND